MPRAQERRQQIRQDEKSGVETGLAPSSVLPVRESSYASFCLFSETRHATCCLIFETRYVASLPQFLPLAESSPRKPPTSALQIPDACANPQTRAAPRRARSQLPARLFPPA